MKTSPRLMQHALLQVQLALAAERDGELPDRFTWEEFKYAVVDPALGNDDGTHPDDYDPDFCGLIGNTPAWCGIDPEDIYPAQHSSDKPRGFPSPST